MLKQHPQLFAVPLPEEVGILVKEEEPQTTDEIFECEGVERRLTKGEQSRRTTEPQSSVAIKSEDSEPNLCPKTTAKPVGAVAQEQRRIESKAPDGDMPAIVDLERRYLYSGKWKFTNNATLKLTGKLGHTKVSVAANLKNSREGPRLRNSRKQIVRPSMGATGGHQPINLENSS